MDHAAGGYLDPRVVRAMKPFLGALSGNPSSLTRPGVAAREAIELARKSVAGILNATPDTIVFTSGGTEANNMTVFGSEFGVRSSKGRHVITTAVEHPSVLEPIRRLEKDGWKVTYLPVDKEGIVSVDDVRKALRKDTVLVSVMYANNEIGSVQPIAEIGKMIKRLRERRVNLPSPLLHTDACQAAAYLPMNVDALHADLVTLNAAKMGGPRGAGALYVRRGVRIAPLILGGGQEAGRRAGTENVAAIVGFGKAVEIAVQSSEPACPAGRLRVRRVGELRDYFWNKMKTKIKKVELNGPSVESSFRLPNNLHVSFLGADAEAVVLYLDARGIFAGTGSACSTESDTPSHVLMACGASSDRIQGAVRFTLGPETTKKDIDTVMKVLPAIVAMVREMK